MKIKIVSGTKNAEDKIAELAIMKSFFGLQKLSELSNDKFRIDISIFHNNCRGLSEIYNEAIETHKDSCDVLLFAHDDLMIADLLFFEKMETAFNTLNYDVVGIAGTNNISLSNPTRPDIPTAWHNSDRRGWSGFVEHPVEDGTFNTNNFGPTPRKVVTLDGLFLAVRTSAITDKIRFDEQFKFHFYDMDFCFNAFNEQLVLGVQGIYCRHNSRGEGIFDTTYSELEGVFLKKWKKK
jgi:GT2 family glycosyltransferase